MIKLNWNGNWVKCKGRDQTCDGMQIQLLFSHSFLAAFDHVYYGLCGFLLLFFLYRERGLFGGKWNKGVWSIAFFLIHSFCKTTSLQQRDRREMVHMCPLPYFMRFFSLSIDIAKRYCKKEVIQFADVAQEEAYFLCFSITDFHLSRERMSRGLSAGRLPWQRRCFLKMDHTRLQQ